MVAHPIQPGTRIKHVSLSAGEETTFTAVILGVQTPGSKKFYFYYVWSEQDMILSKSPMPYSSGCWAATTLITSFDVIEIVEEP